MKKISFIALLFVISCTNKEILLSKNMTNSNVQLTSDMQHNLEIMNYDQARRDCLNPNSSRNQWPPMPKPTMNKY